MSKRKTHKGFLKELEEKCPLYKEGYFKVLGKYVDSKTKILAKNNYGYLKIIPRDILRRCNTINIDSAIYKHNYFLEYLRDKNKEYKKAKFKVVSKYTKRGSTILIEDKYGVFKTTPANLLANKKPTLASLLNEVDYMHNMLTDLNDDYVKYNFKVDKKVGNNVFIKNNFGTHKIDIHVLKHNSSINSKSIIDLEHYVKQKFKSVHGGKYDYSLIKNLKNNKKQKYKIICKKHGIFEKRFYSHYYRKEDCQKCVKEKVAVWLADNPTGWSHTEWADAGYNSENFDSFKVYIIKLWNNEESFYKIGRTFLTLEKRLPELLRVYEMSIIKIVSDDDPKHIIDLEIELLRKNKKFRYKPKSFFHGKNECFSKIKYL